MVCPWTARLSKGDYRLMATETPDGDTVITGLPLRTKQSTEASLVLTMVLVPLGGLVVIGLAGSAFIRRTMRPLEQLSDVATKVSKLPLDAGEVALAVAYRRRPRIPHGSGQCGPRPEPDAGQRFQRLEARQRSETKVRQFVADASHELRTPLTAIRGYTELMRMTETFTEDGRKSLGRVQSQSERMTTLVEDLLLLARLDEGKAPETHRCGPYPAGGRDRQRQKGHGPGPRLAAEAPGRTHHRPGRQHSAPPGPGQPALQRPQAHRDRNHGGHWRDAVGRWQRCGHRDR